MKQTLRKLIPWFSASLLIIIIFGTIYAVMQQATRHDANFPQLQAAEDIAAAIKGGADAKIVSNDIVDLSSSLASFTMIYDKDGKPVSGTGRLDKNPPVIPKSVLESSKGKPYYAVTWEPKQGVRVAAVIIQAKDHYVLTGRSLREVEKNDQTTLVYTAIGGIAALTVLWLTYIVTRKDIEQVSYLS